MSHNSKPEWSDEIVNHEGVRKIRQKYVRDSAKFCKVGKGHAQIEKRVIDKAEGDDLFQFSYSASRHERQWILDSLSGFHELRWIEDVTHLVKGGKEATVYQCKPGASVRAPWLAAKIYRPRRFRNLRNDKFYRQGRTQLDDTGRVILDDGMLHAMKKRTDWGLELLHASWIGHEYKTMQILRNVGADIPIPYASANNAILMEYVGEDGSPAPTLNTVELAQREVRPLFKKIMTNIEIMLSQNRIHADLSSYNILYWKGNIWIIDFPQAIHPDENRKAYRIFERDVTRICEYFKTQGLNSWPAEIAREMWSAFNRSVEPEIPFEMLGQTGFPHE